MQRLFEWGVAEWLLSNVSLAGQLVVLPASLMWLYGRSPRVYRRLRNTVVAAWLAAVPIFALLPVAPPRLARIGLVDTVSHHAAVALTGLLVTGLAYAAVRLSSRRLLARPLAEAARRLVPAPAARS